MKNIRLIYLITILEDNTIDALVSKDIFDDTAGCKLNTNSGSWASKLTTWFSWMEHRPNVITPF